MLRLKIPRSKCLLVVVADVMVAARAVAGVGVVEAPAVTESRSQLEGDGAGTHVNIPFIDHVVGVAPALISVA